MFYTSRLRAIVAARTTYALCATHASRALALRPSRLCAIVLRRCCSCAIVVRPNGAATWQPRATPWGPEHNNAGALKGRNSNGLDIPHSLSMNLVHLEFDERYVWDWRLVSPLQGFFVSRVADPGRCPGLSCWCPLGAKRDGTRGVSRLATCVEQRGRCPRLACCCPCGAKRGHTRGADRGYRPVQNKMGGVPPRRNLTTAAVDQPFSLY